MLLTMFLAIAVCAAVTLMLIAGVAFVQDVRMFSSAQFFVRFLSIFTAFKVYDMVFIDGFLLCKSHFFQYYYPEVEPVFNGRKYGFNIKSQLLRLLVIYPAVSALIAWACTQF